MSRCLCLGCAGTSVYKLWDESTESYSGQIEICTICEALISRQPSHREKQYAAGTLRWQTWTDRTPCVPLPEIEPDYFASAMRTTLRGALPAEDFMGVASQQEV